jgi:hypothetical protein
MLKLPNLSQHSDAVGGALVGIIGSLGIGAAVPAPHTLWELLPYLFPLVGAVVPVVAKRFLYGGAAGDRVRAAQKRKRADALRAKGDDDGAVKLEAEADELDASAAEKEAAAATK